MSGNALPFVGNFYMYFIVSANIFQIQTKYNYMPFWDFQFKYKYCVGKSGCASVNFSKVGRMWSLVSHYISF